MTEGITILKFSGVTSAQFAQLDKALKSEPLMTEKQGAFQKPFHSKYCEIKTTRWTNETLTIEVEVYMFQKWRQNPDSSPETAWYKDEPKTPTPRWVIDKIMDALERF